jgi:hypothetical protein
MGDRQSVERTVPHPHQVAVEPGLVASRLEQFDCPLESFGAYTTAQFDAAPTRSLVEMVVEPCGFDCVGQQFGNDPVVARRQCHVPLRGCSTVDLGGPPRTRSGPTADPTHGDLEQAGVHQLLEMKCDEGPLRAGCLGSLPPTHVVVLGDHVLVQPAAQRLMQKPDRLDVIHPAMVPTGSGCMLDRQDRSRWDGETIATANGVPTRALRGMQPGVYQVQAIIASHHANARTAADTDWPAIVALYAQLVAMTDSAVVRLNHAIAVAMADGPLAGLAMLDRLEGLDSYHLFHSARGELLARAGDMTAARTAFERALTLTDNPAERRHLERRRRHPSV